MAEFAPAPPPPATTTPAYSLGVNTSLNVAGGWNSLSIPSEGINVTAPTTTPTSFSTQLTGPAKAETPAGDSATPAENTAYDTWKEINQWAGIGKGAGELAAAASMDTNGKRAQLGVDAANDQLEAGERIANQRDAARIAAGEYALLNASNEYLAGKIVTRNSYGGGKPVG